MPGALEGLKVIDLSRVLGGPYCAQMLADHGADVIKIEPPQGDETRLWGPPFDQDGISAYYAGINRNKRTVALDLSKPEGRTVLLKLLEDADVLIENFKTGTMEKWGIGYDTLSQKYPTLVHARRAYFSWQVGEESLEFWTYAGDTVRRPVPASWTKGPRERTRKGTSSPSTCSLS